MFREEIADLIKKDPFEPFRIKLVNGDIHDIFDPQSLALMKTVITVNSSDQNWAIFPIDKIASLESLLADYQGKLTEHSVE